MKRGIFLVFLAAVLLAGCGETQAPAETSAPISEASETSAPVEAGTEPPANVATAEDMTAVAEVVEEGMTPVYADSLRDGVYPVTMKSSSSMFKADHCELVVEGGEMYAILYMSSESYPYMYAGTAAEAAAADGSALIALTEGSFTLPLAALDSGEAFAAYSKRKELWYDRTLLFRADSLPAEAFAEGFFTTAASLGLADGSYTVEVSLSGGSGKASVQSPALLTVKDGSAAAEIIWGSSNYDYMKVDGERYDPVTLEPASTFIIPVAYFDRPLTVYADTTAMSQPHEIEYTLTFDSGSIKAA